MYLSIYSVQWGRKPIIENLTKLESVRQIGEESDVVITAVPKPTDIR